MIKFDVEFSERRSEEVIFLLTLSVYINTHHININMQVKKNIQKVSGFPHKNLFF